MEAVQYGGWRLYNNDHGGCTIRVQCTIRVIMEAVQ